MTEYKPGEADPDRSPIDRDEDEMTGATVHGNAPEPVGVYDRPARAMPPMTTILITLLVILALGYVAYIALF